MNHIAVMLCFIVALPALCFGTNQQPEKLVDEYYDKRDMPSTPLEDYFSADHARPKWLKATSSACWRGYIGHWEIQDKTLFLNALHRAVFGKRDDPSTVDEAIPLNNIFPNSEGPVRADWFSGVLRVLDGKRIMSMGFSPVNERDLFVSVICGEVIGKRTVDNTSGGEQSWSDLSWQNLARTTGKSERTPRVIHDTNLEAEDWLDGLDVSRRSKALRETQATFKIRGLFFGTKLWVPPIRLRAKNHENYEFARAGLHLDLDYAPDLDIKSKSHARMVGTTVEMTARFLKKNNTLLVSKVVQLPSGAAIQKKRQLEPD